MAKSIPFEDFYLFYTENKHQIMMDKKDIGNHMLNKTNVEIWLKSIDSLDMKQINTNILKNNKSDMDPTTYFEKLFGVNRGEDYFELQKKYIKQLATEIIGSMRYVSFDEFIAIINKTTIEIIGMLDKDCDIHFIINGEIIKSNTWIALLFMDCIDNYAKSDPTIINKFGEKTKVFENVKDSFVNKSSTTKTIAIYFDDMSYSGTQVKLGLTHLSGKNLVKENYDLYMGVPFISANAIETIESYIKNKINILPSTKIVKSFVTQMHEKYNKPDEKIFLNFMDNECKSQPIKMTYNAYQCYENICTIYFDHKIADGLSTFQKILNFGSRLKSAGACDIMPLISNCKIKDEYEKDEYEIDYCEILMIDIDDDQLCYIPIYKKITYMYKNKPVTHTDTKKTLVEFIGSANNIVGGSYYKKYKKYLMKNQLISKDIMNNSS